MLFRQKLSKKKKKKKKKKADESKKCKERIITKLFYEKSTLLPNSNLFMSVLLLFKFICFNIWTKGAAYT